MNGVQANPMERLHAVVNLTFFGDNMSSCSQLYKTTPEAAERINKVFKEKYSVSGVFSNFPKTEVKGYVDYEIDPYQPGILFMSPEMVTRICDN